MPRAIRFNPQGSGALGAVLRYSFSTGATLPSALRLAPRPMRLERDR